MDDTLIEIKGLSARLGGKTILDDIQWAIKDNEQWALVGNSGSGKTSLAQAMVGQLFHSGEIHFNQSVSIEWVEQQHRFRTLSNTNDFYYQQRFQSQDAEDSATIEQELAPFSAIDKKSVDQWLQFFHLDSLIHEPLIQLSNGENKRLQLCKSMLRKPSLLILDMPFTGLDTSGRQLLHDIINNITAQGIHIILIAPVEELPTSITHIAALDNGKMIFTGKKNDYSRSTSSTITPALSLTNVAGLTASSASFQFAVRMINVTIQYGDRKILDSINWEIKKGEHWSLSGPNGAGKSTLLSLITADNPQAYANEIYLFDKRRGRGESIWDIKKNIGLVSPEMHLYFPFTSTCFEVIASGLFDTIGLFRTLNEEQELQTQEWINMLQLDAVANKSIQQLSMSQQRMTLLARALVKNPPLLVLDEPCQGLDYDQVCFFNELVNQLCKNFGTTLIYVSHYRHQLPSCIDRFLELKDGRIQ